MAMPRPLARTGEVARSLVLSVPPTTSLIWLGVIAAAMIWSTRFAPNAGNPDTPLPFDMAGHVLRATGIAEALRHLRLEELIQQLRTWSVYPPGYYLGLGAWLALPGTTVAGFHLIWAGLVVTAFWLIPTATWPGRWLAATVGGLLLWGLPLPVWLMQTPMLDVPAAILALLSLICLGHVTASPRRRTIALAAVMCILTSLTKLNVGIPLLAIGGSVVLHGLWRRRPDVARAGLIVAAIHLVAVVGFLSWQDHGWVAFFEFARNRANTDSGWERLQVYTRLALNHVGTASAWISLVALGTPAVIRSQGPFPRLAAAYIGVVAATLSVHPYAIDRNLVSIAIVGCGLGAAGAHALWQGSRRARLLVIAATMVLVSNQVGLSEEVAQRRSGVFPSQLRELTPVSRHVAGLLAQFPEARVFGGFNHFGRPWIQTLWKRHHHSPVAYPVPVDLWYPLDLDTRAGVDPRPDPAYRQVIDRVLRKPEEALWITIEPEAGSVWRGMVDYRRRSEWKTNYIHEIRRHPHLLPRPDLSFEANGVFVEAFATSFRSAEYHDGWGPAEGWGRWMSDRRARLGVGGSGPRRLDLWVAAHGEPPVVRELVISRQGNELLRRRIEGEAWDWQTIHVPLPPEAQEVELRVTAFEDHRSWIVPFARAAVVDVTP